VKRSLLGLLAAFCIFGGSAVAQTAKPAAQPAAAAVKPQVKPDFEIPFVSKKLANGLEVIVLQDSSVPLVTVELAVRTGSFTEPPDYNGLSHLFEHMFFKPNYAIRLFGCENGSDRSGLALSQCTQAAALKPKIGDLGYLKDADQISFYNGSTWEEYVNYYFHVTSPYLGTAIKYVNDSVRFPVFDQQEFENERKVVIGELDRKESNPYQFLDLTMRNKLFFKYPSRKNPQGSRETVLAATTDQMRTIQSRYYVPNNSALIVTGDAKPEEVFRLAEQIMGSWEKRPVEPFTEFPLVEHPPLQKSEGAVIAKKIETAADQNIGENVLISIGWQGPSIGKDDAGTYAADVFSYIITQPDSRFQRNLVDSGLASGVSFGYYTQRNVGPIQLTLLTTPEKAKTALKAAYDEIAQFTRPDYYTDEELENSKTILESTDLFDREKPSEYANTLGFWWSSTGLEYFRGYHKRLRAVSRADINRYVNTYVAGKNHIGLALVSPEAQKKADLTEADLIGGK